MSGARSRPPSDRDTLFIADLHLQAGCPGTLSLATAFLQHARGARALYVLGDLVEYWLGDDAQPAELDSAIDALCAVSDAGTTLYLMHGNRDFLLGETFAGRIGGTLIRDDVIRMNLGPLQVSLMHGDTLCTGDHEYQALRHSLRSHEWQTEFLSRPVSERRRVAEAMRRSSRDAGASKPVSSMDVDPRAVERYCRDSNCDVLLHGHTHRPDEHHLNVAGKVRRRLVLGDWHPDHAVIARWNGVQLALETFSG